MKDLKDIKGTEEYYKDRYEKLEKSLSFFVDIVLMCTVPLLLMLIFRNIL
jgi:hypothetical protein